jgi:regulator of sigma E protease
MTAIIYILATVVLLGLCIFIHELGHLLGGKLVGIKAKTFSIGYGKGLIKKEWKGTTYQIGFVPLGGFCSFYGEDPSETRDGKPYEFLTASPLKRIVVVIMGPVFNLIFGIFLFFIMNMAGYQSETNQVMIPDYLRNVKDFEVPSIKAGLENGDRITEINGKKIYSFTDIQTTIAFSDGRELSVKTLRGNEPKEFKITASKKLDGRGYYSIGIEPFGRRILAAGIVENEAAMKSGIEQYDEIKSIDGITVKTPAEFVSIIKTKGDAPVKLDIVRAGKPMVISLTPRSKEVLNIREFSDAAIPSMKNDIQVEINDAMKKTIDAGKIKINGVPVKDYKTFLTAMTIRGGKPGTIIETPGGTYNGTVSYERIGFLGIAPRTAPEMITIQFPFGESFIRSFSEPYDFIIVNLKGLGMLVSGKLNARENLSGPIMIGKIAGETAHFKGISAFIILMAKISIILMIMNLLPIPAVDGSHILFYVVEAIRRKPLNEKIMEKIQLGGIAFLIVLGVFVIFNDLTKVEFIRKMFNL